MCAKRVKMEDEGVFGLPKNSSGPGNCPNEMSETTLSFGPPKIAKPINTRAGCLRKFLWEEFYNEYKRQHMAKPMAEKDLTEYFEQYCKDLQPEDEERKETLINKYPLYCTTAITLWNKDGDITKTFKKKYSITRPIQECTEKFAP